MSSVFVISECCPVGCGGEVVALRACRGFTVFAYCEACGCTWLTPEEAQWEAGLSEAVGPEDRAPEGVVYPSLDELAATPFRGAALRSVPQATCRLSLSELNADIKRSVSERSGPPA